MKLTNETLKNKRILILGDIMLDKYIIGDVNRISPEAPVQVVQVTTEKFILGGAANVGNNLSALGVKSFMCGLIGKDNGGIILKKLFKENNINTDFIIEEERPTTQKVRIMGESQQLLRIDYEKLSYMNTKNEIKLIETINNPNEIFDVAIISDYAKGAITKDITQNIIQKYKTIIDPKPKHKDFYKGAFLVKPNLKEASEMTGINHEKEEDIIEMGNMLMVQLKTNILITCGALGMYLFERNNPVIHLETKAIEVYDVTGAGDTVIATIGVCLASGMSLYESCKIANHAAGIVIGRTGTATIKINELLKL